MKTSYANTENNVTVSLKKKRKTPMKHKFDRKSLKNEFF